MLLGPLLVLLCTFVVFPAFISTGNPAQWRWHPSVLAGLWFPMFNYNLLGCPLFENQVGADFCSLPWKRSCVPGLPPYVWG
jgi:hypothetical protein